jgi:hypothetical protein
MIIFSFCTFIWILTRSSSNIANIMFRFMRSCRTSRIRLKTSITQSIDFWIFASIARFRKSQRSSWSSSLSFRTRFLTKFNQTRNQKLRTSSSSSSRCALSAKRSIIQRTSIVNSSISNEIVINSTKDETIETTNANERTTTTTTTKDLIRRSMTKKKSTRFTSSLISRSWRSWALCFVKSCIELWTRFAFNTMYKTDRRSFFTRRSRNSFLLTI